MKKLTFIFSLILLSCWNSAIAEELTPYNANDQMVGVSMYEYKQVDLLRISPDDNASFVKMEVPGGGDPTKEEILSNDGAWEKVRVSYNFIYNGSKDPLKVCERSGFYDEFIGYRKIVK